jgi:hypothetical protein
MKRLVCLVSLVLLGALMAGCPSNEPPKPEEVQSKSEMNKPNTGNPNETPPGALTPGQSVPQANALPMPPGKGGK